MMMSGSSSGTGGGPSTSAGAAALGGLGGSLEDKDCDLLCPVCFELIEEAYVTRCGHSFCFACISGAIELHRRCPKCGAALASRDHVFPNFLLNELVAKRRSSEARGPGAAVSAPDAERLRSMLAAESARLAIADVDLMLDVLARRKRSLEAQSAKQHHRLLHEFLSQLLRSRRATLAQLAREASLVQRDLDHVATVLRQLGADPASIDDDPASEPMAPTPAPGSNVATTKEEEETFAPNSNSSDGLSARWRRLHAHFDDFVQCYFAHRADELYFPPNEDVDSAAGGDHERRAEDCERTEGGTKSAVPLGLDAFREDLAAFTRYRALRPLATLSYSSDAINYSTIVSTIEFDKDEEFFAIAGVTKRIKVFEYAAVVRDAVDVHYPCAEMQCAHKISCVSWNRYHKNVLASADYEGTVSVWDLGTSQRTRALQEHDKRCWSVHFNACDVRLLASGSDDARVKLWALNAERSVATLEAKFNVCCVRFNPRSACHLAFGSADHCVHYYDLRSPRQPLAVFRDHRKAVSYVKFLDHRTLLSASTDSQLKLWKLDSSRCQRSFTGHTNEKNFVGLATDGRYVACGSENNSLYVYYSGLSRPLLTYRFECVRGFLERDSGNTSGAGVPTDEPSEFVSAVCWRRADPSQDQVLLAANSQGTIKVLQLV